MSLKGCIYMDQFEGFVLGLHGVYQIYTKWHDCMPRNKNEFLVFEEQRYVK